MCLNGVKTVVNLMYMYIFLLTNRIKICAKIGFVYVGSLHV